MYSFARLPYPIHHLLPLLPRPWCHGFRVPREFEDSKLDDSAPRAFSREDVSMAAKLGKQALLSALK